MNSMTEFEFLRLPRHKNIDLLITFLFSAHNIAIIALLRYRNTVSCFNMIFITLKLIPVLTEEVACAVELFLLF